MQRVKTWYVGWPLICPDVTRYKTALFCEIKNFFENFPERLMLDSLLLERGMSLSDVSVALDTLGILNNRLIFSENAELSLEVGRNFERSELQALKDAGMNRVSLSMSLQEQFGCIEKMHEIFENIGLDIKVGCRGCGVYQALAEIKKILELPVQHVSVYFDDCEEHRRLAPDGLIIRAYLKLAEMLESAGFERYTLYDYARAGYRSKTLEAYAQRKFYQGFGMGAVSYNGVERFGNYVWFEDYCEMFENDEKPPVWRKEVSPEQLAQEIRVNQLAAPEGVELSAIQDVEMLKKIIKKGLLEKVGNNRVRLTTRGVLVKEEIVAKLW